MRLRGMGRTRHESVGTGVQVSKCILLIHFEDLSHDIMHFTLVLGLLMRYSGRRVVVNVSLVFSTWWKWVALNCYLSLFQTTGRHQWENGFHTLSMMSLFTESHNTLRQTYELLQIISQVNDSGTTVAVLVGHAYSLIPRGREDSARSSELASQPSDSMHLAAVIRSSSNGSRKKVKIFRRKAAKVADRATDGCCLPQNRHVCPYVG